MYNHFAYTLIFSIVAALGFTVWVFVEVNFPEKGCLKVRCGERVKMLQGKGLSLCEERDHCGDWVKMTCRERAHLACCMWVKS